MSYSPGNTQWFWESTKVRKSVLASAYASFNLQPSSSDTGDKPISKQAISTSFCQWSVYPNDTYMPSGPKRENIPPGVYKIVPTDSGPAFVKMSMVSDELIEIDDSVNVQVLASMKKFWQSRDRYVERGIVYKRGLLLYGPAGSGKTSTVSLLSQTLVGMGGIVIVVTHAGLAADAVSALRRIEPDRNIICIFEDIDELIRNEGEHKLLSLLDGEDQVDNVVNIATTNFPEQLGARIINRPSRFDERIEVGMPSEKARQRYLKHITKKETIADDEINRWVEDTNGFQIAHLRELAIAVFCLDQSYDSVIERLKSMQSRLKPVEEFKMRSSPGFFIAEEDVKELQAGRR